ncbi:hypothetical protein A2U01_0074972 [Trifolium medium]|uniref:Uncharacterized protein n=1 Tax=Trifolium medium TaxID=97028 RepID=A0A392T070_9FABA|nr:hypothetical protein [Trifolium medium]
MATGQRVLRRGCASALFSSGGSGGDAGGEKTFSGGFGGGVTVVSVSLLNANPAVSVVAAALEWTKDLDTCYCQQWERRDRQQSLLISTIQ